MRGNHTLFAGRRPHLAQAFSMVPALAGLALLVVILADYPAMQQALWADEAFTASYTALAAVALFMLARLPDSDALREPGSVGAL